MRSAPSEPSSPATPESPPAAAPRRRTSVVEIALGNGRSLKVEDSIDPTTLARLVVALDGGGK